MTERTISGRRVAIWAMALLVIVLSAGTAAWAQEICDGYDNDADGDIDEGCDGTCDEPREAGPDRRLTTTSASSRLPSMAWTGGIYGVAWDDDSAGVDKQVYFRRFDAAGGAIGAEFQLTTTAENSIQPSVAWAGPSTGFGVVWQDKRDDGTFDRLYFNRVGLMGTNKLISTDQLVSGTFLNARSPSMVWIPPVVSTDPEFAVAFHSGSTIAIQLIRANGSTVSAPITVATGSSVSSASLAWNGTGFAVAWQDRRDGNNEIYFARLDSFGNKIGTEVRVTDDLANSITPSIAWNGTDYGIAWTDDRDGNNEIYYQRLTFTGTLVGAARRMTDDLGSSRNPSVTGTGYEFMLVWEDDRGGAFEIYAARLGHIGFKRSDDIRIGEGNNFANSPHAVWNGTDVGIVWTDGRDGFTEIYFDRVRCCDDRDADGSLECDDSNDHDAATYPGAVETCDGADNNGDGMLDAGCVTSCIDPTSTDLGGHQMAAIVWNGSEFGVVRDDCSGGPLPVDCVTEFQRYDESGALLGETFVNALSPDVGTGRYAMAWTGQEYGIIFVTRFGSHFALKLLRVDASGTQIAEVTLDLEGPINSQIDMVWTGSEYLVAFGDDRDQGPGLYMMRIWYTGTILQTPALIAGGSTPSLVWTGTEGGMAWVSGGIKFARIGHAGGKLGPEIDVSTPSCVDNPSVAWTGTEYGIAWDECTTGFEREIWWSSLNAAGDQVVPPRRITFENNGNDEGLDPSLAWSGSEYGLVYSDGHFIRLAQDGTNLGGGADAPVGEFPEIINARNGFAVISDPWASRITCCDDATWYPDADGDGYGDSAQSVVECAAPPGSVSLGSDCDDSEPLVNPGMAELCDDGLNNDCIAGTPDLFDEDADSWICDVDCDDTDPLLNLDDDDGDTVSTCAGDCDDADPLRRPGYFEFCADGIDNDCNAKTPDIRDDDADGATCEFDCNDGDPTLNLADLDADGVTTCDDDCEDTNAARFPGNLEVCDAIDNDCDLVVPPEEFDADADGFAQCAGDCAPDDSTTYPGAAEINDGLDNQCPGDLGHGVSDEVSGTMEVLPGGTISWPAQVGATFYQIARSTSGDFTQNCVTFFSAVPSYQDTQAAPPGESFHYLVRPISPFVGSWGQDGIGAPRSVICAP